MANNKTVKKMRCNTAGKKNSVKHASLSAFMIDELISTEKDKERRMVLKKLRGELMKIWQE